MLWQHGLEVHFWTSSKHQAARPPAEQGAAAGTGDRKEHGPEGGDVGATDGPDGGEGAAAATIFCKECQVLLSAPTTFPLRLGSSVPHLQSPSSQRALPSVDAPYAVCQAS